MQYTSDALLKLIYDSKALSIWNRRKGPVFWYIAGVPGPFYINTELMIGSDLAAKLLAGIDLILANINEPSVRAQRLDQLVMKAFAAMPVYRSIVETMVAKARENFADGTYDFISGGERRDWLFSIPFAHETGMRHVYLFKNQSIHCEQKLQPHEKALHIADLINNAASYFDAWLPILKKAALLCIGTLCVNSRGMEGVRRLEINGQKVVALNAIELDFFKQSLAGGLIDGETLEEITLYLRAPKEWAAAYLLSDPALFDVKNIDKKSLARLQSFITRDPWNLREGHKSFFDTIQAAMIKRLNGAA